MFIHKEKRWIIYQKQQAEAERFLSRCLKQPDSKVRLVLGSNRKPAGKFGSSAWFLFRPTSWFPWPSRLGNHQVRSPVRRKRWSFGLIPVAFLGPGLKQGKRRQRRWHLADGGTTCWSPETDSWCRLPYLMHPHK